MSQEEECYDCGESMPRDSCPGSKRDCGHHCNCIWVQDVCHWCGAYINAEGDLVLPMRPPDESQPPAERMVREFLSRYRCPAPSGWTEAHVARVMRVMRAKPLPTETR